MIPKTFGLDSHPGLTFKVSWSGSHLLPSGYHSCLVLVRQGSHWLAWGRMFERDLLAQLVVV